MVAVVVVTPVVVGLTEVEVVDDEVVEEIDPVVVT